MSFKKSLLISLPLSILFTIGVLVAVPFLHTDTSIFLTVRSFPIDTLGKVITIPDNENVYLGVFLLLLNTSVWTIVFSGATLLSHKLFLILSQKALKK